MCAPAPPAPPDFSNLAQQQGAENLKSAKLTSQLQNPNVVNPLGTQTVQYGTGFDEEGYNKAQEAAQNWQKISDPWSLKNGPFPAGYDPSTGAVDRALFTKGDPNQATITQQYSPAQQAIFDASNTAKLRLSQLAGKGAETASGVVGEPVDFSQVDDPASKYYNALTARATEDYGRNKEELNSKLITAELRPGTQAYDNQAQLLERGYTDAKNQATVQGRQQAISEMLAERQVPLNEITALMSGSQVNNPFAINPYSTNASVGAAPVFQAGQAGWNASSDIYNAQAAQAGNLQSGLFSLGGSALMGAGMAKSDRRLKSNIQRLGTHPLGIGVYEYDIEGRRERGVMADELMMVKPSAVMSGADGYLRVDYSQIGGRP